MQDHRQSPFIFTNYIFVTTKPGYLNDVIGPIIAYAAITFNMFIILILLDKSLRSPSTILMQGLALSEGLTAFFSYGLEPFLVNYYIRSENTTVIHYPECKIHNYKPILADMFHLVSVLLTTSLGVQKTVALKWPLWTYTSLSKQMMMIIIGIMFLVSMGLHIPRILVTEFRPGSQDNECEIVAFSKPLLEYTYTYFPVLSAVLVLISSAIMIFTSIFIIWSLVKEHDAHLNKHENMQYIRNRSSKLIAALTVTFLVIEFPRIFIFGIIQLSSNKERNTAQLLVEYNTQLLMSAIHLFKVDPNDFNVIGNLKLFTEIVRLLIVAACLSNFIIYIAMSKNMRDVIKKKFCICRQLCLTSRTTITTAVPKTC